ncbi:hypothetical protein HK097_004493, partial [Rhizophlyctis rosea]
MEAVADRKQPPTQTPTKSLTNNNNIPKLAYNPSRPGTHNSITTPSQTEYLTTLLKESYTPSPVTTLPPFAPAHSEILESQTSHTP